MTPMVFPGDRRFAFTVIDDTDGGTVANLKPIYDLLKACGFRTTKTVWPLPCPEGSRDFWRSQTLDDEEYLDFVLKLRGDGFEIASHGATMESSPRERTLRGLDRFRDLFGHDPKIYVNHSRNQENLYWGVRRVDDGLVKWLYRLLLSGDHRLGFSGHDPASKFFWGDLAERRLEYVRNLTFRGVNLLRVNPSMPYRDPSRPFARWWFSTCDADDWRHFIRLLDSEGQTRLESQGGVCIVTTHFGKGFVRKGEVRPEVRRVVEELGRRPGWFVPAGTLLDWLREQRSGEELPPVEWKRMQRQWIRDLIVKHVHSRMLGPEWW